MLDESLLDDADTLTRSDTRGLLRGVAAAGARVRTAARLADEAGIPALRPDGHPRTLLVAGPGPEAVTVADVLAVLGAGTCPALPLPPTGPTQYELSWTLPGWAGPLDLVLLVTPEGTEAGLVTLVEQAYRRGCTVVAVAPAGSPLAGALQQAHGMCVPYAGPVETQEEAENDPGSLWALLTPLLALADRIGLFRAPPAAVQAVADRLDEIAARCGPATATYTNPAKALATELDGALPLVWSDGPASGVAARRFASVLTVRAGRPALAAELPHALADHRGVLAGTLAAGGDPDAFFRDRVEDQEALRLRIVVLEESADRTAPAAPAARETALAHETPLHEIAATPGSTLETLAELIAITDFTAVYLAVGSGARA